MPKGTGAVAVLGCPCSSPAALACAGNAQKVALICSAGAWTLNTTCQSGYNCNSASGGDQGTCAPVDPNCATATAGAHVCGAKTAVVQCGPDLVSESPVTICSNQTCVAGVCSGTCAAGAPCTGSCTSGAQTPSTCNATGSCAPSGTAVSCAPYACGANACKTACSADADCASGNFCWNAACVKVTSIAAGYNHNCALTTGGAVQCWGDNSYGQLGNNKAPMTSPSPVSVTGLAPGVLAVAAGYNSACALATGGAVQCWGDNSYGQLGNSSAPTTSADPVSVTGLPPGVSSLAVGGYHSCVLTTGGAVQCWGDDSYGQVGNGAMTNTSSPMSVALLAPAASAVAVVAGGYHTCALTTAGTVQCWGDNSYGQLGNGTIRSSSSPVFVTNLSQVSVIAAGGYHTCAMTTAGAVQCWGRNLEGQLGNSAVTVSSRVPVPVMGLLDRVSALAPGGYHTCALITDGAVQCWGDNSFGQLGSGASVTGLSSGVSAVAGGGAHTCALTLEGVQCWGDNHYGELGISLSTAESLTPVSVVQP